MSEADVRPADRLKTRLIKAFTGCGLDNAIGLEAMLGKLHDGEIGIDYIEKVERWRNEPLDD